MTVSLPQIVILLLAGSAVGPLGLSLLSAQTLSNLDPAVPVALAVLGVAAALTCPRPRVALAQPATQAATTGIVIAAALFAAHPSAAAANAFPAWWLVALVLAICGATSASLPRVDDDISTDSLDTHDLLVPIVAGGLLLAFAQESSPVRAVSHVLQASAIAMVISGAGWLLVSRTSDVAEQRVFTFASMLLLGGVADYLSLSALLVGLVAGFCWRAAGGVVAASVARDVAYVQQSLTVFVLLLAGAHAQFSSVTLLLAAAYVAVRTAGKLGGAWIAARMPGEGAATSTAQLISPGVFGIAFALNALRATGPPFAAVLGVVMIGTAASAVVALAMRESRETA